MRFVEPKTTKLTKEVNSVKYEQSYYAYPLSLSGVTDESYDKWDGVIEKNIGEFIIVDDLKRIYKSTLDHNKSFPPANPSSWIDWGTINSNRMFAKDEQMGEVTKGDDISFKINFSKCDSIAGVGLNFIEARIIQRDGNGNIIYDSVEKGKDIGCLSFSEYFYSDSKVKNRIVKDGFVWLPSSTLEIIFKGSTTIECFIYGIAEDLGVTLMGTSLSLESESMIKTDDYTNFREIVRYGRIRILDVNLLFDTADFDRTAKVANRILDKNVLWIPDDGDKFTELITIGYIESFSIPIENQSKIITKSKIIGVITND